MPRINTVELTHAALDWAVALALKLPLIEEHGCVVWSADAPDWLVELLGWGDEVGRCRAFFPSSDLSVGMPLVWMHKIAILAQGEGWCAVAPANGYSPEMGYLDTQVAIGVRGETALQAGCRMLVQMALGRVVDVPAALLARPQN